MTLEANVKALVEAGDTGAAAGAVIEALGPAILRYLRARLHQDDDARDAFSQWAENVWHGLPTFRFDATLRTWCYRLAWNAAQNVRNEAWRRNGQRLVTGQASQLAEAIRASTAGPWERQQQALDELRASLDDEDRALLILRLDHELTWDEVSEVLAWEGRPVAVAALTKRYERIKARLGKLARERGLLGDQP
jgi:RNA polymerase sigma-70 factor (ECF subfamily)